MSPKVSILEDVVEKFSMALMTVCTVQANCTNTGLFLAFSHLVQMKLS